MINTLIDTYNVMPGLLETNRNALVNSKQCHINNLNQNIGLNPSRVLLKNAKKTKYNMNPIYMESPYKNGNRFIVEYNCIDSYYKWLTAAVNEELTRLQLEKEVILKALNNEIELTNEYIKYLDSLLFKPTLKIRYALLGFNPSKDKNLIIHSKQHRNTFIKKVNKVTSQADIELNTTITNLYEYRTTKIKEMLEKYYKILSERKKLKRRTVKRVKKEVVKPMKNKVNNKVSNKVSNKVNNKGSNKVSNKVNNKVSNKVSKNETESFNGSKNDDDDDDDDDEDEDK
jgi:ribosomal protein L31E